MSQYELNLHFLAYYDQFQSVSTDSNSFSFSVCNHSISNVCLYIVVTCPMLCNVTPWMQLNTIQ
jgi:hypothetical protein